jgi:hypothetical protein
MIRISLFLVFWTLIGGLSSSLADSEITTNGANSPAIIGDNNRVVIYVIDPQLLKISPLPRLDKLSPDHPHLVADGQGNWGPQDGYDWVNPDTPGDLRVQWVPGKLSRSDPHLVATSSEGSFRPQDGYAWFNPADSADRRVRWVPGRLSQYPNVVTSSTEGLFRPEDGYTWVIDPPVPGDFRVQWEPGRLSRSNPHVVAGSTEGLFYPQDGYTWVNPDDRSDLRVEKIE